jgi:LmbE family N-acetylglucosaminyl deacetylase
MDMTAVTLFVQLLILADPTFQIEPVRDIANTQPSRTDVFLVAHQDDWQLFMGDEVARRIRGGSHAVFIYLTAGDVGRDSLYWITREQAALRSTQILENEGGAQAGGSVCAPVEIARHLIRRCTVGNTESFFLRLPDGKRNGAGYAVHSYQSLRALRIKRISAITAIDGSSTYSGWAELVGTVAAIARRDSVEVTLHSNDPSIGANPHDHFDHRMAGRIALELGPSGMKTIYYLGYALATRAPNLSTTRRRDKTELFRAYNDEMSRARKNWSAYAEHPAFYSECMSRTYWRIPRWRSAVGETQRR